MNNFTAGALKPGSSLGSAYQMLGVLVLAYIVAFLDRQVIALLVAPIKASLQISDFEIALLQGPAFSLAFCVATIPAGILVSRWNRRNVLICGVLFWTAGTILCGLADSFSMLFVARTIVGLGEATLSPAAYTMITDAFPKERVVRAMSIFTMAATLGVGAAFLAGSAVINLVNRLPLILPGYERWQEAFWLISLPGFFVALLLLLVREPSRAATPVGAPARLTDAFKLLWRRAGAFAPIFVCSGLLGIVYYAGFVWYATHLIRAFDFSPSQAGYLLGILYLCCCSLGTALGVSLAERLHRRGLTDAPLVAVALFSAIALATSAYASVGSLYLSIGMLVLQALALASFYGNLVAALQLITPPSLRGVNSAIFVLWNSLVSLTVGASIIGALSDTVFSDPRTGLGHSISLVCLVCSGISILVAIEGRKRYRAAVVHGQDG
ncbi:MFS transporter [Rhizorhapis suberifaciens]|uniref:MFS family permease n=1 Tax=Rhizorhapis suberifaciens TaxID=13656 RepID=A0A840HRA3_9SPHN|nr:MFS transporter [Rhizorhapis suberifaciens]MBB4640157.1 MFS family permease [Rhizorhapis suberifaciens]